MRLILAIKLSTGMSRLRADKTKREASEEVPEAKTVAEVIEKTEKEANVVVLKMKKSMQAMIMNLKMRKTERIVIEEKVRGVARKKGITIMLIRKKVTSSNGRRDPSLKRTTPIEREAPSRRVGRKIQGNMIKINTIIMIKENIMKSLVVRVLSKMRIIVNRRVQE